MLATARGAVRDIDTMERRIGEHSGEKAGQTRGGTGTAASFGKDHSHNGVSLRSRRGGR